MLTSPLLLRNAVAEEGLFSQEERAFVRSLVLRRTCFSAEL
jgi:hypothetical protein